MEDLEDYEYETTNDIDSDEVEDTEPNVDSNYPICDDNKRRIADYYDLIGG
jgi:hypothetical protein